MNGGSSAASPEGSAQRIAVAVAVGYAVALVLISPVHAGFTEWGGVMQYFAGQELVSGQGYHGWASHFWPPLYALLIGLGGTVLPGFLAGKLISISAAAALTLVGYYLAHFLTGDRRVAVFAQLFLAAQPVFFYQALHAHNHMLSALLFTLSLLLFLRAARRPSTRTWLLAGAVAGLAMLTRYTTYVLVFLPVLLVGALAWRDLVKAAAVFWSAAMVVNLPWWVANAWWNGSPLHNWDYMNVGVRVVPNEYGITLAGLMQFAGLPGFNGVLDLLRAAPVDYVRNVVVNLKASVVTLVTGAGVLALFVMPAAFDLALFRRAREAGVLFGLLAGSVLLVSQAYVLEFYFLDWVPFITIISTAFLVRWLDRLSGYTPRWARLPIVVPTALLAVAVVLCGRVPGRFRYEDAAALVEQQAIADVLRRSTPDLGQAVVMASMPGRAYHLGSRFLCLPLDYAGEPEGMASYDGYSRRVLAYAPKFPSALPLDGLTADFLIYCRWPVGPERQLGLDPVRYEYLLDPEDARIPRSFEPLYHSANVVVYRIRRAAPNAPPVPRAAP